MTTSFPLFNPHNIVDLLEQHDQLLLVPEHLFDAILIDVPLKLSQWTQPLLLSVQNPFNPLAVEVVDALSQIISRVYWVNDVQVEIQWCVCISTNRTWVHTGIQLFKLLLMFHYEFVMLLKKCA